MNPKLSGWALALIGIAAINACAPIDDSHSRRNRSGRNRPTPAATPEEPSLNANRPAPQNLQSGQKSMAELESEELGIRSNAALSPAEKQQQLHRIWKEQRDLTNNRTPISTGAPATTHQEHASRSPEANPSPDPAQGTTPKSPATEEAQKSQSTTAAATSARNPAPTPKSDELKYASKVPGRPGLIRSPYDGKLLDATGIPPGTQVKDPDSGKIMLVP